MWETIETNLGENNRQFYIQQKEEQRNAELRARGYVFSIYCVVSCRKCSR